MSLEQIVVAGLGGLAAGILSSAAGLGGGLALVAIVSIGLTPHDAVALTAPVIAFGAVDRSWMFRHDLDVPVLGWLLVGALPLTLLASFVMTDIPAGVLRLVMGGLLFSFIGYQLLLVRRGARPLSIPLPAFAVVGMLNGGLAATVGGGGPVTAAFLHGRGLRRGRFVGTASVCTGSVNVLKTAVFATTGVLTLSLLPATAAAAISMPVGNRLGRFLLRYLSDRAFENVLFVVLAVVAAQLVMQGGTA